MLTVVYVVGGIAVASVLVLLVLSMMAARPGTIGTVNGKLSPVPDSPNCVSTQATDELHAMNPLTFSGSADQAFLELRAIVSSMPSATIIRHGEGYLYAEFRSRMFRFVDDVEFVVDRHTKVIHFRSASRVGHSDLGVNRTRMERIRRRLEQQNGATGSRP